MGSIIHGNDSRDAKLTSCFLSLIDEVLYEFVFRSTNTLKQTTNFTILEVLSSFFLSFEFHLYWQLLRFKYEFFHSVYPIRLLLHSTKIHLFQNYIFFHSKMKFHTDKWKFYLLVPGLNQNLCRLPQLLSHKIYLWNEWRT